MSNTFQCQFPVRYTYKLFPESEWFGYDLNSVFLGNPDIKVCFFYTVIVNKTRCFSRLTLLLARPFSLS